MSKDILPDSRMLRPTGAIEHNPTSSFWVPIFCANCGAAGGRVPEENMTFAFWLCNSCWEKQGPIAGTMALPDEVFWAEVREQEEAKNKKEN